MAKINVNNTRHFLVFAYSHSEQIICDLETMLKLLYSPKWRSTPEVKEYDPGKKRFTRTTNKEIFRLASYYKKKLSKAGFEKIKRLYN